ncbi:hypothetical protein CFAM422_004327 [Trichoderma lentiforme]|uniref:Uncharacterized protein n=1 Tax=Trichoderma lentiforme TaxID=1567552 RepID=A0A9P4XHX3_9HYPO|nr:hypothetical protein CFAM422_004327 [Trichoderma lentiforme]
MDQNSINSTDALAPVSVQGNVMLIINQMGWSPSLGKDDGRIGGYSAELAEMELVSMVMQWCLPNLEAEICTSTSCVLDQYGVLYASLMDDATGPKEGEILNMVKSGVPGSVLEPCLSLAYATPYVGARR